jgi:hypothetical protein
MMTPARRSSVPVGSPSIRAPAPVLVYAATASVCPSQETAAGTCAGSM